MMTRVCSATSYQLRYAGTVGVLLIRNGKRNVNVEIMTFVVDLGVNMVKSSISVDLEVKIQT